MEQGKHRETICQEAEKLPQYDVNRESDDEKNSVVLQEMMDTNQSIQRLIRTELEGSDHVLRGEYLSSGCRTEGYLGEVSRGSE